MVINWIFQNGVDYNKNTVKPLNLMWLFCEFKNPFKILIIKWTVKLNGTPIDFIGLKKNILKVFILV